MKRVIKYIIDFIEIGLISLFKSAGFYRAVNRIFDFCMCIKYALYRKEIFKIWEKIDEEGDV